MDKSDLRGEAQFHRFGEIHYFVTTHIFANWLHLVALTQLSFSGTKRFTKKFHFSLISLFVPEKKYWARVPTIMMPPTFPIASLNRYTPNFSGVPQKLTWCQQFGLQIFPKWGDANICRLEMAVFMCFFGLNKFSWPNGRLLPIACHTYLESYGT